MFTFTGKPLEECMCFTCGYVSRKVTDPEELNKHLKTVHGKDQNRTPSQDVNKPYKCET